MVFTVSIIVWEYWYKQTFSYKKSIDGSQELNASYEKKNFNWNHHQRHKFNLVYKKKALGSNQCNLK